MAHSNLPLLSIVVPLYNEAANLERLQKSLLDVCKGLADYQFEYLYVNDGSIDDSIRVLNSLSETTKQLRIINLARNFGKEVATTAGLHAARGQAIITLDADGQHPVELIPEFIAEWERGAKVVVGVRTQDQHDGIIKHLGSKVFYQVMNRLTAVTIVPGSSDYRLIDRTVQQEFTRLTERNRITRGLIDWLGYKRAYVDYVANPRINGSGVYSIRKLTKLFIDSIISSSISPLYIAAYMGAVVLPLSFLLGIFMFIDKVLGDPAHLRATGGAYVVVLILFLIGVLLMSQGIIGLYLSHIHSETQNRPLYIIDYEHSKGLFDGKN